MVLTPRQEKLLAVRDEMSPGSKPSAIVPRTFAEAQEMCRALARSGLVPNAYVDKPENMIVTIMAGAEIGLPPMASIRLYHVMDNIPRLGAEGIRAVLLSHPEIEYFEPVTYDDKQATWIGKRRGRPEKSVTWTVERAKRAGLWDRKNRDGSPGNWQKYTENMLNARASMELGRIIAPDIVAGMVSREEASDGDFIDAAFTEAKPQFAAPVVGSTNTGELVRVIGTAPQGPPPGVPQAPAVEPPRRGPGRPPKDKPADPTPLQPSSAGSSAPAASSATSPSSSVASTSAESPPSKLDAAVREVEEKLAASVRGGPTAPTDAAPERPTPLGSSSGPTPSAESAAASTAATTSGAAPGVADEAAYGGTTPSNDGFGSEDPVDTSPKLPTMADFMAWVASCKTQRDLAGGLGQWRAWSKYMCDVMKDDSYKKTGANTILMQDAYSKRKGEVPA